MKIYLAPMEGITTFIYRNAFHHYYGGIDKYFTPFLSGKSLNYKEVNDVLPEHNRGIALVPQILANQSETFLAIAAQLADYGYQEVNLNLGCPSGTVVSRKRGAGFLSVPEALDRFLEEIFTKCPLSISIKTRIGIDSAEEWETLLDIFAKYPMKELIIHPRLQQEFYNGSPHAEAFARAQERLSVPLCYNGEITSPSALTALKTQPALTDTTIDTVMLGRGAIANPQLPALLKDSVPESTKDWKIFRAFHDEILGGYQELMSGDQPVLFRMKELWSYMGAYPELSEKQLKKIKKTTRMADYGEIINSVFAAI